MMHCAVTGASGFIGRRLVDRLLQLGAHVRLMSRKKETSRSLWPGQPVEVYEADLAHADKDLLSHFLDNVEVLFHCAGEIRHPQWMHAVHCAGTLRLCQAAAGRIRRWVQLSSVGVYGPQREGEITEETALSPCGLYETTKALGDLHVVAAALQGGFSYTLIQPSIVFGPDMPNPSVFQLIAFIDRGLFFHIGGKPAIGNYIHVSNVVEAMVTASRANAAANRTYILSDDCSLADIVDTVAEALDRPHPAARLPERPVRLLARWLGKWPSFPLTEARVDALTARASYVTRSIQEELGYRHRVRTQEGMRQMALAWRQRKGCHA